MKNILLVSLLASASLYANTIQVDKGWELLGTTSSFDVKNKLNNSAINSVWAYDNTNNEFNAYSPNATIQSSINSANITELSTIEKNKGFWISASSAYSFDLNNTNQTDTFSISPGWRLVGTSNNITNMNLFDKDSIKVVWKYNKTDSSWSAYSPDATVKELIENSSDIKTLTKIDANDGFWILGSDYDMINIEDFQYQLNDIKSMVSTISQTNTVATVTDAKNLFANLREATTTLFDMNIKNQELNTSTIAGTQSNLLTTKLKPSVDDIIDNFNTSLSGMEESITSFQSDYKTNFIPIFESINSRIEAIHAAMKIYEIASSINNNMETSNWSLTSSLNDTISHTYSEENNISTETFTLNDQTITIKYNKIDEVPTLLEKTGTITLTGTGYNLNITELAYLNNSFNFKANGKIESTIKQSNYIELSALDISFDYDDTVDEDSAYMIKNAKVNFDGKVVVENRTVIGKVSINENKPSENIIEGSYTGTTNEPSFTGTITSKINLNDIKDYADEKQNWYIQPNALLEVTYENGTKSFVKSHSSSNDDNVTLTTQDGNNINCSFSNTFSDDISSLPNGSDITKVHTVTCTGGTVKAYYGDDKIITMKVNGVEKVVSFAYLGPSIPSISFEYSSGWWYDGKNTYSDADGNLMYDGEKITISDLKMSDRKSFSDVEADIFISGNITDGTKSITAKAGIKKLANSDKAMIYVEDITIKDQDNIISIDNLFVSGNLKNETTYNYTGYNSLEYEDFGFSKFENYSIKINSDYSTYYNYMITPVQTSSILNQSTIYLNNLQASVSDSDNKELTLDISLGYNKTINSDEMFNFNGYYEYNDTSFKGDINIDINQETENGSYYVKGEIQSNGFQPFSIENITTKNNDDIESYATFTRGENYTIAISAISDTNTTNISLSDNNGIKSSFTSDATNIIITNTQNAELATYGENTNGNDWEIKYQDNTSETLF